MLYLSVSLVLNLNRKPFAFQFQLEDVILGKLTERERAMDLAEFP